MARHLPDPEGTPDSGAREIMAMIEAYLDSATDPTAAVPRDIARVIHGLRHVYHCAEISWDESLSAARETMTWPQMQDATGIRWGTLQGRVRAHRQRTRAVARTPVV